jgi:glutamine cyclotransferase
MKTYNIILMTALVFFNVGCGSGNEKDSDVFAIEIKDAKKVYTNSQTVVASLKNKKNKPIEHIEYYIDTEKIATSTVNTETNIDISKNKLGLRTIKASITADGKNYNVTKDFTIVSSIKPKLYTYKVLESYPHDIEAYTQGLEFVNDTLYESTGQYKESSLRKTDFKTGKVIQNVPLGDQYFGEGLTILNDKIYQLTWREDVGFIYDLSTMEKKGTFVYGKSNEGWGLCNDNSSIYKSDGTEKIWTLNPENLSEEGFIEIYTNTSKIKSVNELEWVEGKIYANVYERDAIAIVDPATGAVEGVIDLKGLKEMVTQHDDLNVLNGIAYKGEENIIYVTGKNWDKLFKIEITEK